MIAKRIRKQGQSSFKRLAAYVTGERNGGRGDPTGWQLADYIIDKDHAGEKVAAIRVTNCKSSDPGWAIKECCVLAEQNTRSKRDKSYHLVVSFPEGERPTSEQMIDIEDEIARSIGFEAHKRISAIHQNTDNWHLHIAICSVHPVSFRNIEPYYDHLRLQEACQVLERKHGLQVDRHARMPERPLNGKAGEIKAHATRVAFAAWVQEHAGETIIRAGKGAQTWDDLHAALARNGLVIKPRGAGLVIAHHADDKIRIKASEVSRDLSMKALTDRLGPYQRPGATPAPEQEYARTSVEPTPSDERIWDRYKREQAAATDARSAALQELRTQHQRYGDDLNRWYQSRYEAAFAQSLGRADRKQTLQTLAEQKRADRAERRERERKERDAVKAQHQGQSWAAFLEKETARGNRSATRAIERLIERDAAPLSRNPVDQGRGMGDRGR